MDDMDETLQALGMKARARGALDFVKELYEHFDGHYGRFLVIKQLTGDKENEAQFGDVLYED